MLSRSSGESTIKILRNFDEKIFQTPQCPELLIENECIEALNGKTLIQWKRSHRDMGKRQVHSVAPDLVGYADYRRHHHERDVIAQVY